jgi:hypothetical protein
MSVHEATVLWRGVVLQLHLFQGGFATDNRASSKPILVAKAWTPCAWPEAQSALVKATRLAANQTLENFLDALSQEWDLLEKESGEPLHEGTVLLSEVGSPQLSPHFRPSSPLTKSNLDEEMEGAWDETEASESEASPTFEQWLASRTPLHRFEHASRGLAWDYPPSKVEKRELLVLHLVADEEERYAAAQRSLASLRLSVGGASNFTTPNEETLPAKAVT